MTSPSALGRCSSVLEHGRVAQVRRVIHVRRGYDRRAIRVLVALPAVALLALAFVASKTTGPKGNAPTPGPEPSETPSRASGTRTLEPKPDPALGREDRPERELWIEVVDARTGEALGDAEVYLWTVLPNAARWTDSASYDTWSTRDPDEPLVVRWNAYMWLVVSPGYRSLSGNGADWRERESDDPVRGGKRVRFELERGILREVFVYVDGGKRVAGAVLSDSEGVLGTTDVDGFVLVDALHWPDQVEVELEGFHRWFWNPNGTWADWQPVWIGLEREED